MADLGLSSPVYTAANAYNTAMQETANIQQTQANTDLIKSHTAQMQLLAQSDAIKLKQQQREEDVSEKIQALNQIAQDTGQTPPDPMTALTQDAGLYFQAGLVDKGETLVKAAAEITTKQAQAGAAVVRADAQKEASTVKTLDSITQGLGAVQSQEDWDRFKAQTIAANPKDKAIFDQIGDYSPEKVEYYKNAALKYKDKLAADNQAKRTQIYEKLSSNEMVRRNEQTRQEDEKLAIERTREARLTKAAGSQGKDKPAGLPTKQELGVARDGLEKLDVDVSDAVVADVAGQARQLWKNNPGLTQPMAVAQVVQGMIKDGTIQKGHKEPGFLGFGEKTVKGQVFDRNNPQPLPDSPDKFVVGQYYQLGDGRVVQRMANGKGRVVSSTPPSAGGKEDDDE